MTTKPTPLFDTYEQFNSLDFESFAGERPEILDFLRGQPAEVEALESYRLVRLFLKQYNGFSTTFTGYRTHIERLLLWTILVAKKPILMLKRADALDFIAFCQNPPKEWIGPVTKSRFVRIGKRKAAPTDRYEINPDWRPFNWVVSKAERKQAIEYNLKIDEERFEFSEGSLNQMFNVCSSFYEFMFHEGLGESNPIKAVKQRKRFTTVEKRSSDDGEGAGAEIDSSQSEARKSKTIEIKSARDRVLSPLQWEYIVTTVEKMAAEDPVHERTLFIVACLFSMYLRVSDLVGRKSWKATMGAFAPDHDGNWWMTVVGKGEKVRKISVRDEFIEVYLKRYRLSRGLTPYPKVKESTPILTSLAGRDGLSDRQVRAIVQDVFDRAYQAMQQEGRTEGELNALRAASLHWLRHTSATFDAKIRPIKHLQIDLGHSNQSTTEDIYYNSIDEERASTSKRLTIKDR